MSAQLALAEPRRIKASHHRRRKIASGPSVQRYYDPQSGRFLSVDPAASEFNRYDYAANNPYRYFDPDGRARTNGSNAYCSNGSRIGDCDGGGGGGDALAVKSGSGRKTAAPNKPASTGPTSDGCNGEENCQDVRASEAGERGQQGEALESAAIYAGTAVAVNVALDGLGRLVGPLIRFFRVGALASRIAGGHAYGKHIGEFARLGIKTERQFARHVDEVMANPTAVRNLERDRVAYWDQPTGTVVISDPGSVDGGTAFIPKTGIEYFEGLK